MLIPNIGLVRNKTFAVPSAISSVKSAAKEKSDFNMQINLGLR